MFTSMFIAAAIAAATHQPRVQPMVDAQQQPITATLLVYRLKEDPRVEFVAPGEPVAPPKAGQGNRDIVVVPDASMLLTDQNQAGVVKFDTLDAQGSFLPLCWTAQTRIALGRWLWEPLSTDPKRSLFPTRLMTPIASPRVTLIPGQSATIRVGQQVGYMAGDGSGCFRYVEDPNNYEGIEATLQVSPAPQGKPGDLVIDRMNLAMSWVEHRQPVPGVALDIGAPVKIERASTAHTGLTAAGCNRAFLFAPRAGPENERFVIVLLLSTPPVQAK